jgi:hypothetical protein
MVLYVLTTLDPQASRGTADWYFDNHAYFLRALSAAKFNNIFIIERTEYLTELDAFNEWMHARAKQVSS